jgi:TRAP-type C4-dicarboxylate transport system substrate-binding protein
LTQVAQEAAARATDEIKTREGELVSELRQRGIGIHEVDRESFRQAIRSTTSVGALGYEQRDYDRIIAIGA